MNAPLSAAAIATCRRSSVPHIAIEVIAETGSTNADLLARIDTLRAPTLLAAEHQTAGRGRAGRMWHADPGATLTFSLAWKFELPVQALAGLPLAVGVAIAETLASFDVNTTLKWPNDVLKDGNKLAGILIETAAARNAPHQGIWAVIGIGLNIAVSGKMALQIGRPVADMDAPQMDRNLLLAALLDALAESLAQFDAGGFAAFMTRWNRLHAHAGREVAITDQGKILHEGQALGVDEFGRLLLDTGSGRVAIIAGDVSLRVAGE